MDESTIGALLGLAFLLSLIPKFWETAGAMVWAIVAGVFTGTFAVVAFILWHAWTRPRMRAALEREEHGAKLAFARGGARNAFNSHYRPLGGGADAPVRATASASAAPVRGSRSQEEGDRLFVEFFKQRTRKM